MVPALISFLAKTPKPFCLVFFTCQKSSFIKNIVVNLTYFLWVEDIISLVYFFYILRCADNSLYCGMTTNLENRFKEHNSDGGKGAKYLRGKKPVKLVYSEEFPDIKTAMNRELEVKKWTKTRKEALVKDNLKLTKKL